MDNRSGTARAVQAAAAGWGAILRRREPRRRPAPRPRRTLFSVLAVGMVALGLPLLAVSPASAHTPAVSATCADGITVTGTGYEAGNTNTLGIQLDGGTWVTKTFATSDSLHVAVPQNDGIQHTWRAYVHTTNPNTAYSKDYPAVGQPANLIGPCGTKHVTAVLWDKTPPTCEADGTLVPKTEPDGITVTRTPVSGTGPGSYTINFTPKTGFAIDGPTSQQITVLPKLTGDVCATVVQPVTPTVTNPSCTGPGTGTAGSFTLPADGGGVTYTKAGDVVTATADATHKFGSLPAGWTPVDAHHATYTVTYSSPAGYPACLELAPPVNPVVTQSTCTGPGTHSEPIVTTGTPGDHIGYAYDAATHVVTATPDAGYALGDLPDGWVSHENGTATYLVSLTDPGPCLVLVPVPTPPAASAPTCNLDGALVVMPTDNVVTTVDDEVVTEQTSFGPGQHTIEYAPATGYVFDNETPTSKVVDVLPSTKDCPTGVVNPTVTQSVCTGPGTHSQPVVTLGDVEGDHVSYVYDAAGHVVTATPDAGFALADLPTGWVAQEGGTATFVVVLTDPGTCAVVVSPPVVAGPKPPAVLPNTGVGSNLTVLAGIGLALIMAGGLVLRRRNAAF